MSLACWWPLVKEKKSRPTIGYNAASIFRENSAKDQHTIPFWLRSPFFLSRFIMLILNSENVISVNMGNFGHCYSPLCLICIYLKKYKVYKTSCPANSYNANLPYHDHEQGGGLVHNTLSFKSRGLGVSPGRVIVKFSIQYILPFWCLSVPRREA